MSKTSDLEGDTYMGYPCHRTDKNDTRRAYNRLVTGRNISENHGDVLTGRYFDQFNKEEQNQLFVVGLIIKKKGLDYLRQQINHLSENDG